MKLLWFTSVALLGSALPVVAQDAVVEGEKIVIDHGVYDVRDLVVAKGVQQETEDQIEVIDVVLPHSLEGSTLPHSAEAILAPI